MDWCEQYNHDHDCRSHDRLLRRRTVVAATGTIAATSLAGCLGTGTDRPEAAAIGDAAQCDVCGMVVAKHPGPNGQIFYEDERPESHDNPARFDSLKKCFFPYRFERDERGWSTAAMYVTDYSAVDYEVTTTGGETYISSHRAPESFAPARDLYYVVESDVNGAMGPEFLPFGASEDADAFAEAHGGRVLAFEDVTPELVGT
jgi:copper chaperone NosL